MTKTWACHIRIHSVEGSPSKSDSERKAYLDDLRHVKDSFRKLVITGNLLEKPWRDESGITSMGIMTFLLDPKSLETL